MQREIQPGTDRLVEPVQQSLVQQWCVVAVFAVLVHAVRDLRDEHGGRELFEHRVEIQRAQLATHRCVVRDVRGVLCLEQFSEIGVIALVPSCELIDQGKVSRQIGAQHVIQLRGKVEQCGTPQPTQLLFDATTSDTMSGCTGQTIVN